MSELKAIRMNPDEVAKHAKRPTTKKARGEKRQARIQAVFAAEVEQKRGGGK